MVQADFEPLPSIDQSFALGAANVFEQLDSKNKEAMLTQSLF
jgi:hypothetical protein